MIIHSFTLGNIKKIVSEEDSLKLWDNIFCVADWITRDPKEPLDFTGVNLEDFMKTYPNPSGAKIASETFCDKFIENAQKETIKESFILANKAIARLNKENNSECDYLYNDFRGCVASGGKIEDNILHWGYVWDCGIIIFDKKGEIKMQSIDDVEHATEQFEKLTNNNRNKPENRVIRRREFRNNPLQIIEWVCYGFGALTWEENMKHFLHCWETMLEKDDYIVFYTDWFTPIIQREEFFKRTYHKSEAEKEKYFEEVIHSDPKTYGKEKTIISCEY